MTNKPSYVRARLGLIEGLKPGRWQDRSGERSPALQELDEMVRSKLRELLSEARASEKEGNQTMMADNRFYRQPVQWVVWSEEQGGWWLPTGRGYTNSLLEAGRFSEAAARKIVEDANRFERLREVALPDPLPPGDPR
jgi:hypothetical protein